MFERLSVLIVEESRFVAGMLSEILRELHVGNVQVARSGADAVGLLRSIGRNKEAAAVLAVDIVIADYALPAINGPMLLRWLRQRPDSPDRFLPLVMLSAAPGNRQVQECRELGVTEFLVKPFSVKAVAEHILGIIDHPRPFLHTHDYFGPDRRRQNRAAPPIERRVATKDDIEIVYSGKRARTENSRAKAFLYQLPNRLRDKIAGSARGPLVIDPAILEGAERQLDRLEGDYAEWVKGSLQRLYRAYGQAASEEIAKRPATVAMMNRIALELRGQGTTFGYPLITEFAKSLYECTENAKHIDDTLLRFIKDHIDGITVVIRDRMKGMAGEVGAALVAGLEQARTRRAAA
jgi:CheY-like chemotaxis protein